LNAPPAARSSRVLAWWWFVASATVLAAAPLAPSLAAALPACPLRRWTGIPCLTCGGTRAVVSLAEGDPVGAFSLNPAVTVAAVAFVAGGIAAPFWLAFGGKVPELASLSTRARVALAAALLASWLWVAIGPA
jgi:hypothetical protein